MTDVTFPGYIMILVVCAVTLFLIIPKGDTVITPVMEITVTETVEMTDPRTVTKGEEVAVISPGTTLRIYAVSGISLWAEDSRDNRGYVPASILGDRYYLAEALGFPSKGKNEMHISKKKILEIFQPGKTFAEIDGQPLYAQTIRSSGGQLTADFRYTVYDAEAKMIHSGIRAVFSDGVLESWEWGTVKDEEYTLALKAIPWTETLIGLPLIKDLNFKKPVSSQSARIPLHSHQHHHIHSPAGHRPVRPAGPADAAAALTLPAAVHKVHTQHRVQGARLHHGICVLSPAFHGIRSFLRRQRLRRHRQAVAADTAAALQSIHLIQILRIPALQPVSVLRPHAHPRYHR